MKAYIYIINKGQNKNERYGLVSEQGNILFNGKTWAKIGNATKYALNNGVIVKDILD